MIALKWSAIGKSDCRIECRRSARKPPIAERGAGFDRRLVAFFLERKSESGPDLVHRVSIDQRISKRGIEAEIVLDLPDGADENRTALGLCPYLVVKRLKDGANFPCRGSFEDDIEERLAMLIAGEVGLDVEMRGAPVPALRHDAGPTESDPGIGIESGQQRSEFHRDAWAGLALEHAGPDHPFEERTGRHEAGLAARRNRGQHLGLQNHFPTLGEPVIEDHPWRDQNRLRSCL